MLSLAMTFLQVERLHLLCFSLLQSELNEFAHSLNAPLSFSTPPVSDRVADLRLSASSLLNEECSKRSDFAKRRHISRRYR